MAYLQISPEKEKVWIYSNMINHFIHTISNKMQGFKKSFNSLLVDSNNTQYNSVPIEQEKNKCLLFW